MQSYSLSQLWPLDPYSEATMLISFLGKLTEIVYMWKNHGKKHEYIYIYITYIIFCFP